MSARTQSPFDATRLEETTGLQPLAASTGKAPAAGPQSKPAAEPEERRQDGRRRALKTGRIVFNDRQSVIDCVIRNLSENGACLEVTNPMGIPDFFELELGQGGFRHSRIAWRQLRRVGVAFL
ncbi:MAG TPA: PilZ domain-containing protein [Methylocella sp.]|nr:PilZ domain-containing protein [Methylocella sp.]